MNDSARILAAGAALGFLVSIPWTASAAEDVAGYPSKPIRIVIGFSAGSTVDVSARFIGQKLSEAWKQQIVAENRPSAGGIIAAQAVANAAPDGYTLLSVSASHAVAPAMYAKLPYDTVADFAGITTTVSVPALLIVGPDLAVKTMGDLIAMAKARPGEVMFSSAGIGSATHFSVELFQSLAGIRLQHVPYKGIPEAMTDAMVGRVQLMFAPITNAIPLVKDGRLRALAVTPPKRLALLPEVPTVVEAGVPGYHWETWFGLLAPAKTPRAIVEKLNREVTRILGLPETKERWNSQGAYPVPIAADAFDRYIAEEIALFTRLARAADIKAD
jgi:tripartite-type tricarboxylate transporter receptor subunit TctC